MKKLKIYAGGSYIKWKKEWVELLEGAKLYHPFTQSRQDCLAGFTLEDLEAVDKCDLILFIINYPVYACSCLEAGYAFAKGKPIIVIWLLNEEIALPPMLVGVAYNVFTNLEAGLKYIKRRFIDKEGPVFFSKL